jgi:hypothetical protein
MRRVVLTVVGMMALTPVPPEVCAQASSLEYEVKAAFLLNFSRYVNWPADRESKPFRVCLFGNNPFGGSLEAALADETWPGGAITVERVGAVEEARDCHLLYVPAAVTDRFLSNSAQLVGHPVLTVGESRRFLMRGGMIQLFLDANRVRFSVNHGAAETAGLRVSSRLLRLAREVLEPPGGSR